MKLPPRKVLRAAQLAAALVVLFFVARTLAGQWRDFRAQPLETDVSWPLILASGALVLATYALLIQTWRLLIGSARHRLPFMAAARVWNIANLGKYVPGKIWQITALGAMAASAGVPAASATSAAILGTLLNIVTGVALVLGLGWSWLELLRADARNIAIVLVSLAALGLAALPLVIGHLNTWLARFNASGGSAQLEAPDAATLGLAIAGNVIAWALYGIAFFWLVRGVIGAAPGPAWVYVAVYAASYIVGYLFFFIPGGIGPREAVMVSLLASLGLLTPKQALLTAAVSRVWITILELIPGLIFLASGAARRARTTLR